MGIYFEDLKTFRANGGLKASTITAKQLLPAVVSHMQRMDRQFTLHVNGRLPKSMDALLEDVFELCHLQQPFYTQHCASRSSRYRNVSKNRVKVEFTLKYRMTRDEEKWVVEEIRRVLGRIIDCRMQAVEKVAVVHDYIVRTYDYEMETKGSPFTVYTFMQERKGVCMAYALLFEKMMDELGIPCYYVVGHADGEGDLGHAWNMVELDGEWYHIDVTWNDLGKRTEKHEIRYRYFLRSDEFMKQDHVWNLSHYPLCISERFAPLTEVYDAVIYNGCLYFPHPKTAKLVNCSLVGPSTCVIKKVMDLRVQYCTLVNKVLYFSNFDDGGTLYTFDLESHECKKVSSKQVDRIQKKLDSTTVYFVDAEPFVIEDSAVSIQQVELDSTHFNKVPFMQFGQCFFGSYEGTAQPICFEGEGGIQLLLTEELRQITVDLLIQEGKWFDIQMTTRRKPIKLNQPFILRLPVTILGEGSSIQASHGQAITFVNNGNYLEMSVSVTGKFFIR